MFRWLVLGLLAWLIYRLWQQFNTLKNTHNKETDATQHSSAIEPMVKCAHCELHIPKQQAITYDTRWFCCTEHKDAHSQS